MTPPQPALGENQNHRESSTRGSSSRGGKLFVLIKPSTPAKWERGKTKRFVVKRHEFITSQEATAGWRFKRGALGKEMPLRFRGPGTVPY